MQQQRLDCMPELGPLYSSCCAWSPSLRKHMQVHLVDKVLRYVCMSWGVLILCYFCRCTCGSSRGLTACASFGVAPTEPVSCTHQRLRTHVLSQLCINGLLNLQISLSTLCGGLRACSVIEGFVQSSRRGLTACMSWVAELATCPVQLLSWCTHMQAHMMTSAGFLRVCRFRFPPGAAVFRVEEAAAGLDCLRELYLQTSFPYLVWPLVCLWCSRGCCVQQQQGLDCLRELRILVSSICLAEYLSLRMHVPADLLKRA
jgi:hypothetical protein